MGIVCRGKKRIFLIFHTELSGYSWREEKNAGVYKGKKWPIIVGKYKKNAGFTKKTLDLSHSSRIF